MSSSPLQAQAKSENLTRGLADTVGFAQYDWQMDSIITRINSQYKTNLIHAVQAPGTIWKTAVCPHDDYCYAGWLYQAVLSNVTAKTVIIFGVAHRAKSFNLENQLIFDSYKFWHGPYGQVKVSALRDEIINQLPDEIAIVHDSMQTKEHSVEALIPFLQAQNREIEIISILVPYMDFERMQILSQYLAKSLYATMEKNNLQWSKDIALLISSDAVHYGDEEWGGSNYAPYGTDKIGNAQAIAHEQEIIKTCFEGQLTQEKIARFFSYTVNPDDYREYKWTWCGRYAIPVGLLTSIYLNNLEEASALNGVKVTYSTSISHPYLKVDDLNMGQTAVATTHHWVGYPAIGFK